MAFFENQYKNARTVRVTQYRVNSFNFKILSGSDVEDLLLYIIMLRLEIILY